MGPWKTGLRSGQGLCSFEGPDEGRAHNGQGRGWVLGKRVTAIKYQSGNDVGLGEGDPGRRISGVTRDLTLITLAEGFAVVGAPGGILVHRLSIDLDGRTSDVHGGASGHQGHSWVLRLGSCSLTRFEPAWGCPDGLSGKITRRNCVKCSLMNGLEYTDIFSDRV